MQDRINKVHESILSLVLKLDPNRMTDAGLLTGKLGIIMYLVSLSKTSAKEIYNYKIEELFNNVLEEINVEGTSLQKSIGLIDGLSGFAYIVQYLKNEELLDDYLDSQMQIINEIVFDKAKQMIDDNFFDFFYGPIGVLHYLDYIGAEKYCEELVDKLYDYGVRNDFIYYNITGDSYTEGLNFGYAHGSSAIVTVMLNLYKSGCRHDKCEIIANRLLGNMLKFRRGNLNFEKIVLIDTLETSYRTEFPYNVVEDEYKIDLTNCSEEQKNKFYYSGRLGWCNSDLNVLFLLYRAGTLFDKQEYIELAKEIEDGIIARVNVTETKVKDSFMCHGSSGIAMIYRTLSQATNNMKFNRAHELWLFKTIDFLEKEITVYKEVPEILQLLTGWLMPSLELVSHKNSYTHNAVDRLFLCSI
ncbi:lanthionine synthetase LanC family protein [Elizabethkingia anophelis]|uniref:lanthionine synthetase LanC family protein n=1 Tax=Elizabethkingia anophelis TaxID=1117645 RepID=UPI00320BB3A8